MSKQTVKPRPDQIDINVGQRLKQFRKLAGLSQQEIAGAAGVTFQQIQKYENGKNRVSASRLFQFSQILGVELTAFYEDEDSKSDIGQFANIICNSPMDKTTLELLRLYQEIDDLATRKNLLELLKSFVKNQE